MILFAIWSGETIYIYILGIAFVGFSGGTIVLKVFFFFERFVSEVTFCCYISMWIARMRIVSNCRKIQVFCMHVDLLQCGWLQFPVDMWFPNMILCEVERICYNLVDLRNILYASVVFH